MFSVAGSPRFRRRRTQGRRNSWISSRRFSDFRRMVDLGHSKCSCFSFRSPASTSSTELVPKRGGQGDRFGGRFRADPLPSLPIEALTGERNWSRSNSAAKHVKAFPSCEARLPCPRRPLIRGACGAGRAVQSSERDFTSTKSLHRARGFCKDTLHHDSVSLGQRWPRRTSADSLG